MVVTLTYGLTVLIGTNRQKCCSIVLDANKLAQAMGDGWTSYALDGSLRMAELRQYAGDQTLIQVIMIHC
jgi:hypothetical protein